MRIPSFFIAMIALGVLFAAPHSAKASTPEDTRVLLVYDSLAKGTSQESHLASLQRLFAAMGVQVKLESMDSYQLGELNGVKQLVFLRNVPDELLNNTFIHDLLDYKGAYLHIGYDLPPFLMTQLQAKTSVSFPEIAKITIGALKDVNLTSQPERFPIILQSIGKKYGVLDVMNSSKDVPYGVKEGNVAFVPYFGTGMAAEIAMGYVLADWLGIKKMGEIYLIFKEINPFKDLKLVERAADQLYEAGMPFIFSIRPVFENTDYPAMKRYLEVLKYTQSRNGSIIVQAPVISSVAGIQNDDLEQKMTDFINLLAANEIVPLGIGAESEFYWRNVHQFVRNGMAFFDSAVLFQDSSLRSLGEAQTENVFLSSPMSVSWNAIAPLLNGQDRGALPVDLAVTFDFASSTEQWEAQIQELKASWISFDDYRMSSHRTHTESNVMESKDGLLFVNQKEIALVNSVSEVIPDFPYREPKKTSFTWLFKVQNNIYLIVIGISLLLFSGFFIFGYKLYKRKYLR